MESEDQNSDINKEQKEQEILPPEELEEIQSRWEYKRGILHDDALSVILFILQVNPSSFLLENVDGYKLGKLEPKENLSHLFFVDDLKLYAINIHKAKLLFDIIITFTKDVGMSFGKQKCAYVWVEKGKRKSFREVY